MSAAWLDRLAGAGRTLGRGLAHLLLPECCHLCAAPLAADERAFCRDCRAALTADPSEVCPRCAATIGPFAVVEGRCRLCRAEPFAFAGVLRLGAYAGALRDAILRIKHAHNEGLAEWLGELWAARVAAAPPADVAVPVPLHWRRRLARGYNQSTAVARGLAARLGLPVRPRWLRRVRHTAAQSAQAPSGRRDNVRGAFRVPRGAPVRGCRVLLVDDVMTTGATAHEAARALRAAGAAAVTVAVLARASGG